MKLIISIRHHLKIWTKSFIALILIVIHKIINSRKTKQLFGFRFARVNIICPGPSCEKFREQSFKKDEAFIFINHGLIVSDYIKDNNNKFFISADGTRVREILKSHSNLHKRLFSIITPEHLFHLNHSSIKNTSVVLIPSNLRFSTKYGIIAKNYGPEKFSALKKFYTPTGFGSMISALQLALIFEPLSIRFWGCDIGEVGGVRYFDKAVPVREVEYFELARNDFSIVKEKILAMGIKI